MPIDNVLFEDLGGLIVDVDVTNTGAAGGVLFDQIMMWFTITGGGGGEVSFTF
jgi:hypothetical protein